MSSAKKAKMLKTRFVGQAWKKAVPLSEPAPQAPGIASSVKDREHIREQFGVGVGAPQGPDGFQEKLPPKSWLLVLIPRNRLNEFCLGNRLKGDPKTHPQPNRLLTSAFTSPQGIPSFGLASNSAQRRSSSAACSGVRFSSARSSTSPNSFHICSTSSRFSAAGKPRKCCMISDPLMFLFYPGLAAGAPSYLRSGHSHGLTLLALDLSASS